MAASIVDFWWARSNPRLGNTKADFVYYTKDHGLSPRHARATMKANDATTAARATGSIVGYEHAAKLHREAAALHRKGGDSSFVAEHAEAARVYEELAARMRRRDGARPNSLYAVSLKTGASKRVDKDRKTLLMAIYKRLHQVGDGRIVNGKHVVMHAPSGFKTFVLEDMTDDELKELGAKLAGRRSNPAVVKKQRLAGRPNPRIIDVDDVPDDWVSNTIDNACMTYEAGEPIEKDRPIGDGYRLSVSRDDKNGLIGWTLDDSSDETVGAGSLGWINGKPRVALAAIESSASGRGLYPQILLALRSILGVPIESDLEVTEAALKAWKKAGGKLKRLKGVGSVMRINPAKRAVKTGRPNPRPRTIFQSGPPLPDDPFAYFRKRSGFRELDVKAIDNHGRKYPVVVYNSDSKMPSLRGKIVLQIVGTPGSWFLHTILEGGVPAKLAIDLDAGWIWDNVREVMAAI